MDVVSMKPVSSMHAQFLQSLQPYGLQTPRPLCPWDSPGKDTEVGCHALLQGIFPTQELNPSLLHLPHCTWILYPLSHLGSPISAISSVQFSRSVMSDSLLLHEPQHARPPYPPCQASLPPSTQTHVHWVGDAIQPSNPLLSPSPPTLNLSQYQGLFKWVSSSHQLAKVLEFQLQHQSYKWTPRTELL